VVGAGVVDTLDAMSTPKRRSVLVDERLGETAWGRKIRDSIRMNVSDPDAWIRYQKATFTRWINARLGAAPPPLRDDVVVGDLFVDLRDGLILYYLVAILSHRTSTAAGRPQVGRGNIIAMHNVGMVLKYLARFLTSERQQLPDAAHVVEGKPVPSFARVRATLPPHARSRRRRSCR